MSTTARTSTSTSTCTSSRPGPSRSRLRGLVTALAVAPLLAAHIHVGSTAEAGPVVVTLSTGTGCTVVQNRELLLAIITNPSAYYVNVHNADYPAGALRGQLDQPGLG